MVVPLVSGSTHTAVPAVPSAVPAVPFIMQLCMSSY